MRNKQQELMRRLRQQQSCSGSSVLEYPEQALFIDAETPEKPIKHRLMFLRRIKRLRDRLRKGGEKR